MSKHSNKTEYSHRVLREFLVCQPPHLAMVRAVEAEYYKNYLPFKGKILDVGCGHGEFLKPVFDRTPYTYGIDPDKDALEKNKFIKKKVVRLLNKSWLV